MAKRQRVEVILADETLNEEEETIAQEEEEVTLEAEAESTEEESEESTTTEAEDDEEESEEPGDGEEDSEETVITIEGVTPDPDEHTEAPEWVRELRKQHRETQKENRELKAKLEATQKPSQVPPVGDKPKMADFDYDATLYEEALATWYDRKRQADKAAADAEAEAARQEKAWQDQLNTYTAAKQKLGVKDYEEAEEVVLTAFNPTQQGIVVSGARDAALVFYALGKNPKKVQELAAINDPVKFAFAVSKLEENISMSKKKRTASPPPPPESRVSRGTGNKAAVDSTLERLRAEAEKTGNYTKINAYKRQQRQKQK